MQEREKRLFDDVNDVEKRFEGQKVLKKALRQFIYIK